MSDRSTVALGLWLVGPGGRRPGIPWEFHLFLLLPGPPLHTLLSPRLSLSSALLCLITFLFLRQAPLCVQASFSGPRRVLGLGGPLLPGTFE